MRTILHLVRHDLRSQWLVLVALAVVLIAEVVSETALSAGFSGRTWQFLMVVRILLLALATGLIVQQDPLVGTAAFWRTRPTSCGTLLASKTVSLVVALVLIPATMIGLAWYTMGVYAGDAVRFAAFVALEFAAVVLMAAMAAVVTPNLTHLAVAGVAGGTMLMVLNTVIIPTMMLWWPGLGDGQHGFYLPAFLVVLFVLGVPAVVWQYLRLKDWQSAALVGVALVAAELVALFGPMPLMASADPPRAGVLDPQAIMVNVAEDSVRRDAPVSMTNARAPQARYSGEVTTDGYPRAVKIEVTGVDTRLLLRDRTFRWQGPVPRALTRRSSGWGPGGPLWEALEAAVGPAQFVGRQSPLTARGARVDLLAISGADERQAATPRGLLTADLTLVARRTAIIASTPLKTGSRLRRAGAAATILSARHHSGVVVCRLRVAAVGDRLGVYVLLNRSRQQAVYPSQQKFVGWGISTWLGGRSEVRDLVFATYPPTVTGAVQLDAEWLAGAELVEVADEPLGTFTRQVQVAVAIGPTNQ